MKVHNPRARELRANVFGKWYCIEPGSSIEVRDPKVAACLVEYGATMTAEALAEAREKWAGDHIATNARHDSAPGHGTARDRGRAGSSASAQGVADPSGTQTPPTPPAPPTPEAYDPADHTRDEVLAYLAETEDVDERIRVQEAENARGDKARVTIVEWTPPAPPTPEA